MIRLLAIALLSGCVAAAAQDRPDCSTLGELACLESATCMVAIAPQRSGIGSVFGPTGGGRGYVCREANQRCEAGFRQNQWGRPLDGRNQET